MEKRIGKYKITIQQDDNPDSPRSWDNLGTMVCFHKRYDLGDKHDYDFNDYSSWSEMEKAIVKNEDAAVILPLYLYDHSGITISTTPFSCRWDSGQIGFIFCTKKDMESEFIKLSGQDLIERCEVLLKGEVETYDQYLTGDVYGYEIYELSTCDHGHEHEEFVDSCWGFYGEDECLSEAESIVNHYMEKEKETTLA
jgi:hypothetical protein